MPGYDTFAYDLHKLHHSFCDPLVQLPGNGGRTIHPGALLGNVARSRERAQESLFKDISAIASA